MKDEIAKKISCNKKEIISKLIIIVKIEITLTVLF